MKGTSGIHYAVPAFHVHAHGPSCLPLFHPRRLSGFGHTDGEAVERLWSELGPYARSTKEMLSGNRIDTLEDALLFIWKRHARTAMKKLKAALCKVERETPQVSLTMRCTALTFSDYINLKELERRLLTANRPVSKEGELDCSIRSIASSLKFLAKQLYSSNSQLAGTHTVYYTQKNVDVLKVKLEYVGAIFFCFKLPTSLIQSFRPLPRELLFDPSLLSCRKSTL